MTVRRWICTTCRPIFPCILWTETTPRDCIAGEENVLEDPGSPAWCEEGQGVRLDDYIDGCRAAVLREDAFCEWYLYGWRCMEGCHENPCVLVSEFVPLCCVAGEDHEIDYDPDWIDYDPDRVGPGVR